MAASVVATKHSLGDRLMPQTTSWVVTFEEDGKQIELSYETEAPARHVLRVANAAPCASKVRLLFRTALTTDKELD